GGPVPGSRSRLVPPAAGPVGLPAAGPVGLRLGRAPSVDLRPLAFALRADDGEGFPSRRTPAAAAHRLTHDCGMQCFFADPLTPSVGTSATAASRCSFVKLRRFAIWPSCRTGPLRDVRSSCPDYGWPDEGQARLAVLA